MAREQVEIAKKNEDYKMQCVIKPVMSEKASNASGKGIYVFLIGKHANKIETKKDIFKAYGIMPEKVNIINRIGKRVRTKRIEGRRSDGKMAVVIMPKDKRLPIFEQK